MVTPRIAGFKPGTSPPPVRMPMTPFLVLMFAMMQSPFRRIVNRQLSTDRRDLERADRRRDIRRCDRATRATLQIKAEFVCRGPRGIWRARREARARPGR